MMFQNEFSLIKFLVISLIGYIFYKRLVKLDIYDILLLFYCNFGFY